MKKYSPSIQLFLESNEAKIENQVNDIPKLELETTCQRVLDKNPVYKILQVSSSNPKVNAEKVIMLDYFQTENIENILNQLKYSKHPFIKTPIGYKNEVGQDAKVYYNIKEKGTLQALFDYYDKKNQGLKNNFSWYFSSPNSDNSLDAPISDAKASENLTIPDLSLTIEQKIKILIGIASALLYLQQAGSQIKFIIPSAVLLNDNFEPCLINTELPYYTVCTETDTFFFAQDSPSKMQDSDLIYSFGVLSYWLLAERRPFYYTTIPKAIKKLQCDQVPLFPASLPQEVNDILTKCFSSNPQRRPPLAVLICTLYDSFKLPSVTSYANSFLPQSLIAATRLANLGPENPITKLLNSTTPQLAGQNLFKASEMAENYPVSDRFLAYNLMYCSANFKYTDARLQFFVMMLNEYLGDEDTSKVARMAFDLVSKWSADDIESNVLLAKCYEFGIGCKEDKKKAYDIVASAQSNFSSKYQRGIYLEKQYSGNGGGLGSTLQKDAIRDSPDEDNIDSFYRLMSYPPFRDTAELMKIISYANQNKKRSKLYYRQLELYLTTTEGTDNQIAKLLISLATDEFDNNTRNEAIPILKLLTQRKKGKDFKPTEEYNISKEFYEKICQAPTPDYELNRRAATSHIISNIIRTQKLSQNALNDLEKSSADDKRLRAHYLLSKEDRDIVEAENLLMELEADENQSAKAELILLRLSLSLCDIDDAYSQLQDLADNEVPEAFNALAYYGMKCNYSYLSEVRINLAKAVDCGCIAALYNLAQYDKTMLTTSLFDIEQIDKLQKQFYETAPPSVFGVFDML